MKNDSLGAAQDQPVTDDSYTIRCLCDNKEDDGYTIACDSCSTWQHVACYYQGDAPGVHGFHACLECEPRTLDINVKPVVERQRRRRDQNGTGERKTRRSAGTKVQRRKLKEPTQDPQPNGTASDRKNASSRDHQPPPAKRPKTTHRASGSIHSAAEIRKPTALPESEPQKPPLGDPSESGVSPADSTSDAYSPLNGARSDYFSAEYLKLCKDDPGESLLETNLFNNISITCTLAAWIHDSDALFRATNRLSPAQVFQRVDGPFDALEFPEIVKRTKPDPQANSHGQNPLGHYLTVENFVPAGGLVGELKGEVGHQQDYIQDTRNRWRLLRHPEPFVFFHPDLPIYIDTRREGTRCRYIRRSCRPNIMMKTLITNGIEYHFCLCALVNIEPGTEITIGWDPDREMGNLLQRVLPGSASTSPYMTPAEQDSMSDWVERVLTFHGGCACKDTSACAFANLNHKRRTGVHDCPQDWAHAIKRKRSGGERKVSPPSVGQSINSRAASENFANREPEERDESRSTSGSFPSKPQSRDITPLTHFSSDVTMATPGIEMSDREKRKIAAVERTFEQLEHDNQHQARRRKRNSTVSGIAPGLNASNRLAVPSASISQPVTPSATVKSEYTDSSTAHGVSISPSNDSQLGQTNDLDSPIRSNQRVIPILTELSYVDASTQTDKTEESWYEAPVAQPKPKPFVPLTKRILKRCHEAKLRLEEEKKRTPETREIPSQPKGVNVEGPAPTNSSATVPNMQEPTSGNEVVQDKDPSCTNPGPSVDLQKPRPPDPSSNEAITSSNDLGVTTPPKPVFLPPPPPPRHSTSSTVSNDFSSNPTRQTSTDLRVQLPPNPHFHPISPPTPSTPGPPIAQSPSASAPPSALFSPSIVSSISQPSPIKKKLSLSDYVSRKHKMEMSSSSAEKAAAPQGNSTSSLGSALKPSPSSEETKSQEVNNVVQDSATTENPTNSSGTMAVTSGVSGDPQGPR
ncbi:MAG: hypothetical protein M1816_000110 [Peltula sp. TS41687]|nr:MAG: hypothetical protein M1816_000110 [Peltula sp. TS41687]